MLLIVTALVLSACGGQTSASTTATSTSVPTSTPQVVHYPPTTLADLRGLAAKGDASAIHEFHAEFSLQSWSFALALLFSTYLQGTDTTDGKEPAKLNCSMIAIVVFLRYTSLW